MALKIKCDCGWTYQGATEEDVVKAVQKHGRDVHNMEVTREQALALAEPA